MKIRVNDIPASGLKVNDTISLESLNARMREGTRTDIVFTQAPRVDLMVNKTSSGAETAGIVTSKYRQPCARCAKELDRDIEVDADFTLQHRKPSETDSDPWEDDIGVIYFEGDTIDLEDVIQETLILALSAFWKPPEKEDGTCTLCGLNPLKDRKVETGKVSLGKLLMDAGVKSAGIAKKGKA